MTQGNPGEGKTIEQYLTWLRENPTKIDLDGIETVILISCISIPDTLITIEQAI